MPPNPKDMKHQIVPQWFTTAEAADYLRLAESSLRTFRSIGKGPRYCKVGRYVRYRRDQLDDFMNGKNHNTSHEVK